MRWFIKFHGLRHPRGLGKPEVEAFLTMLAHERKVSASTHRQALSALLFLYKEVLVIQLPWLDDIGRPVTQRRIPSVLTQQEVQRLLQVLEGEVGLLARVLYGTGMRLMECLSLRVKDVDFARGVIVVREGKGGKDRVVMLPQSLVADLQQQLRKSHLLWESDRAAQRPGVYLPHALEAKYPRRARPGPGTGCFLRPPFRQIRAAASSVGTICTRNACSAPSRRPCPWPASTSMCRSTPCATALPRICCRRAQISVPCRSCWGTAT